ncbi:MAG: aldehyde dehydrogenase family protein, partial [Alcanivoracaceae bacterium]|nr:aldehyde dehydrogenase family protein [Alcanivoracaceae bacterium]
VCVSVQRVFAARSIVDTLIERLADRARQLAVGDPLDESTEVGPLIRTGEADRVEAWVAEAREAGANIVCGGTRLAEQYYAPTVIADPAPTLRVSREEIFGPVLCIFPYDDLDSAIAQANDLPYAFQAAVFTDSLERALHVSRQVDASAVMVNDHTAFRVDGMPFAGLRESGLGVGGIPHTIRDMQIDKMLVIKSGALKSL